MECSGQFNLLKGYSGFTWKLEFFRFIQNIMQGLCLVDWGRGIDFHLFPDNTEFKGDCRTSGFRCIEMQEDKPWRYQV